jgi:hypothetical protein
MNWLLALAVSLVWLVAVLLGKGGFIHMLLLVAVAIVVMEGSKTLVARRVRGPMR